MKEYLKTAESSPTKLIMEEPTKSAPISTVSTAGQIAVSTPATVISTGLRGIAKQHQAVSAWEKLINTVKEQVEATKLPPVKVFISYVPEDESTTVGKDNNHKVEKRLGRLVGDLRQVGMEVYYDKDISANPSERDKQLQTSDVLIPIATPMYKKLAEDKSVNELTAEYKAILSRAKAIPDGMLPLCLLGSRRDAVPKELGDYLVRVLTDKSYESDLAAHQNPLDIIPAAYQLSCSEGSAYYVTVESIQRKVSKKKKGEI